MPPSIPLTSLTQTEAFGAQTGDIFLLRGDLGAGKTTLTQSIGVGLKVPPSCYITSPTFSLLHEYPGRLNLYHFDLYRLEDEDEIAELGFEEIFYGDGISIVEWPDRLGSFTPPDRFEITLTIIGSDSRLATISAFGSKAKTSRFNSLELTL